MASLRTIVAVDPSVTKTGLVIRDAAGAYHPSLIDMRPKRGQAKPSDPGRLVNICDQVLDRVERLGNASKAQPLLLVIEDCIATQGQARLNIALQWMLRVWIADNLPTETLLIAPSTLKKFSTGHGNAEKGTIGAAIMKRWGDCVPDGTTEDVLEALALCKLGECWLCQPVGDGREDAWLIREREVAWYTRGVPKVGEPDPREAVNDSESLGHKREGRAA